MITGAAKHLMLSWHLDCRWVQYYQQLMTGIVGMGTKYQNAVMVDILNEPDARGLS